MAQRIFIHVIGFSDEERHALNTVFRLSEQCLIMYQLWTPGAPEAARVLLLDGSSYEGRLAAESPSLDPALRVLWIGINAPPAAWRSFTRPISWYQVIEALDALFAADAGVDLELEPAAPPEPMSAKHALIVSPDPTIRLYLRARLALARVTLADEADSGSQALGLLRDKQYDVALVDCTVPDMTAWVLLRHLRKGRRPVPHVALTKRGRSPAERLRAWLGGADALLDQPPHPARLGDWLKRI
jgi:CheY-like chemotaxis protein